MLFWFGTALNAENILAGFGTPKVDGVLSPGEWDGAGFLDVAVNVPEGGTTPGRIYVLNDDTNLYLALRFERNVADPGNTAAFTFRDPKAMDSEFVSRST